MKNNLRTHALRSIAAITALSLFTGSMTSCATTSMSDRTRTITEGIVAGGLGGAAIAALITQIFKGNSEQTIIASLIGAGVGSVALGLYGQSVANQKQRYIALNAYLQNEIDTLENTLTAAELYNDQLSVAVRLKETGLAQMQSDIALANVENETNSNIAILDQAINRAEQNLVNNNFGNSYDAIHIRNQIQRMKQQQAKMSNQQLKLTNG